MATIQETISQYIKDATIKPSVVHNLPKVSEVVRKTKAVQDRYFSILRQIGTDAEAIATIEADLLDIHETLAELQSSIGSGSGAATAVVSDYNDHLIGARDGLNKNFVTRFPFIADSARVYLNGQRLSRGVTYDFIETGNTTITFIDAPYPTDNIIIDYNINISE